MMFFFFFTFARIQDLNQLNWHLNSLTEEFLLN